MASRRKITKQKRQNKRVKLVARRMRANGKHVNRDLINQMRAE